MARARSRKPAKPRARVAYRFGVVPLSPPAGGWGVYDYDAGQIADVKTGLFAKRQAAALASGWNAEIAEGTG